jgi:hypothetical protein
MSATHASLLRNATGGRAARLQVYGHLADSYQDSGLLGALMEGSLDAPEQLPAGAARADDYDRCGAMQLAGRPGAAA